MQTTISVDNRKEADEIKRGLDNPQIRAFVKVCGVLLGLPSDRARARVLRYVADKLTDETSPLEGLE